ncbi:MAG: hypothetical protein RLZZ385_2479 [Pseudomonadota bacterium]|jgi:peroxiredoxin Q/BCP
MSRFATIPAWSLATRPATALSAILLAVVALVSPLASALEVGDKAPDFTLQASDGKTYQLSDLAGKPVVIAFFPKAFTGGCTIECKAIRDSGEEIRRYDISYFMASVDDIALNTQFAEEHDVDFPILADPDKSMVSAYGALNDRGVANRWTVYIDATGTVVKIHKDVNPATAGVDLTRSLGELQFPTVDKS